MTEYEWPDVPKNRPEIVGDGCECWVVPERYWTTHYGAVEPGSTMEYNPECPKHGDPEDDGYEDAPPEYNFWDDRTYTTD